MGSQGTDQSVHPPGVFGPVCPASWAADLGVHQPGLQVCAGAAYLMFTVQRLRGWAVQEATAAAENSLNSLLSASIFSFSF